MIERERKKKLLLLKPPLYYLWLVDLKLAFMIIISKQVKVFQLKDWASSSATKHFTESEILY